MVRSQGATCTAAEEQQGSQACVLCALKTSVWLEPVLTRRRRVHHPTAQTSSRVDALSLTFSRSAESIRLFNDAAQKPSCAPPLLSPHHPGPLPAHLRTPSPALQRIAARMLSPEVEVEMEVEEEPEEEEVESDPEVEYAGASAADYGASLSSPFRGALPLTFARRRALHSLPPTPSAHRRTPLPPSSPPHLGPSILARNGRPRARSDSLLPRHPPLSSLSPSDKRSHVPSPPSPPRR